MVSKENTKIYPRTINEAKSYILPAKDGTVVDAVDVLTVRSSMIV